MLSAIFLRKKDHNFYLGCFLLIHSFILLKYLGYLVDLGNIAHHLIRFSNQLEWLPGPFFYFYVRKYHDSPIPRKRWHFLPAIIHTAALFPILLYAARPPGTDLFQLLFQRPGFNLFTFLRIVQGVVYIILSFKDTRKSPWLKMIISLYATEIAAISVFYLHTIIFGEDFLTDFFIAMIMMVSVNIIAFSGIKKSSIFAETQKIPGKTAAPPDRGIYKGVFDRVKAYIENERIYLSQNTRLSDLSEKLSIPEKQISQSVNEMAGENINSFINRYRIRLAEKLLIDKSFSNFTIDAIAEECGFSNKVSFYKAFKRIHNMSPKEYKDSITTKVM